MDIWLCGSIPDFALQLAGFQLFRTDHDTELSGKTKGGCICFYTNSGWCNDVTMILQHYLHHLETLIINCKPFYFTYEFVSFILVVVYICTTLHAYVQHVLADQILSVDKTNRDSLGIVLGDFNKGNLSH